MVFKEIGFIKLYKILENVKFLISQRKDLSCGDRINEIRIFPEYYSILNKLAALLTCLIGPIQTVLVVVGFLRYQPIVALSGFTRAKFDVDPIVLILNPLHRHRPLFAVRARVYQTHEKQHTRPSIHTAGRDKNAGANHTTIG